MDELAAQAWLRDDLRVSRETFARLEMLVAMLRVENVRQNLVSAASLDTIWSRHIVDSAQLLRLAGGAAGPWLDLGSGGGLPGLVLAVLNPSMSVVLVESRRLRWEWLRRAATALDLAHVTVESMPVEKVTTRSVGIITARAFAPLGKLFALAHRFSTEETLWLLPKGRSGPQELASTLDAWQCDAHMEPSVTDPHAAIIVARHVRPLARNKR